MQEENFDRYKNLLGLEDYLSGSRLIQKLKDGVPVPGEVEMTFNLDNDKKAVLMLYAKKLDIIWGQISRYWEWKSESEGNERHDAAYLKAVCWLQVSGKFNAKLLSPNTLYKVVLRMKINGFSYGWRQPVKLSLQFGDITKVDRILVEREETFYRKRETEWTEKPIGFFRTRDEAPDMTVNFSVDQRTGYWKRGLAIKGVAIRPATEQELASYLPCTSHHGKPLQIH